jgi:hypothetical protein
MKPSLKDLNRPSNRLIDFFKRLFSRKRYSDGALNQYKRDYDRFPLEFEVVVSFFDSNGEMINDRAALHDVSGSGAMFFTKIPEKYYLEQALQLKIYLAGTDDVRGCIKTEAFVVRIKEPNDDQQGKGLSLTGIAVKFHKTFEFERVDRNVFGEGQ